ncbi:MAG TPA: Lrp/AsnC family transcriptional regulator [Mycobacterium sp.]|nr:Lrp/AsnC family transcriptional regulator [Mycobacterium sp.]
MPKPDHLIDDIDTQILHALIKDPRATVVALAHTTGLARNTIHSRLARLEADGVLQSFERRIDPAALGYPLTAFIMVTVTQRKLSAIGNALESVPEVIEVHGLSGVTDLLVHIVARNAEDLYRVAGQILDIDGVEKTTTGLVMRRLVDYRLSPLLASAEKSSRPANKP